MGSASQGARGGRGPRALFLGILLFAAAPIGCRKTVRVEGSSCNTAEDCKVNPSCSFRVGGCTCESGACYIDPNAPVDPNATGCRGCHGSLDNAAPPKSVGGSENTADIGVGAHQTHLLGGVFSRPVSCSECHKVPTKVGDPGHIDSDLPAEVTFGGLANAHGATATWDRTPAQCTSYCHGATMPDGSDKTPIWTKIDGSQAACGNCHGTPPALPHPQSNKCEDCHGPTAGPNLTIANRFTHIDGVLQVPGGACNSCHGDSARALPNGAAPPKDLNGADIGPKVGAHLAHLTAANSVDVTCESCHLVPATFSSPGHVDDSDRTAEITFSGLAIATGTPAPPPPSYDFGSMTCSTVYCHGATLTGGNNTGKPVWPGGPAEAACDACHGNPPPLPHPQKDSCSDCHPGYTKTGPSTGTTTKATHVNGTVESTTTCASCHGTAGRTGSDPAIAAAPPKGTQGEIDPITRAVGAHMAHLNAGTLANAFACTECHVVPTSKLHTNGVVDLAFGGLATNGGSTPAWNRTANSCATVYCHGNIKNGNPANAPVWVTPGTPACGSCHGSGTNPLPGGNHPATGSTSCGNCHPGYTSTTVNVALHVNGVLDVVNLDCMSCHGDATRTSVAGADANQTAAPPIDTLGNSAATARGVGAHVAHLNPGASAVAKPLACSECHPVPASTSHSNGTVELIFGTLAKSQGSAPTWTRGTATCATAWCHGGNALLKGGTKTSIVWNNGTTVDCTSCHGNPPPLPHPQNNQCSSCHPAAYSKTGATTGTVDLALHVNGNIDTTNLTCTTCHGTAGRASVAGADPAQVSSPPIDSLGNAASTALGVGAHQMHVNTVAGAVAKPIACAECHGPVPTSTVHEDGIVQIAWGPLASAQASAPTWTRATATCGSAWCHGGNGLVKGGNKTSIVWNNGTTTDCTSCHGNPPPLPHPQNDTCSSCHSSAYSKTGATTGTVDLGVHVNGIIDVANLTCSSCHGTTGRASVAGADPAQVASPPTDSLGNSVNTALGVGAHQMHVNTVTGAVAKPFACAECHGPVPTSMTHQDGIVQIAFGTIARSQGSAPTWTRGSATCATAWCHGGNALLKGGTQTSMVWNTGLTTNCTSCHGNPPPSPHPQNNQCNTCHAAAYSKTGATTGTVDLTLHVNGTIDVANLTCTSCHGTTGRASVAGADPAQASSPPTDSLGNSAATALGVGAHQMHVNTTTGAVAKPFACAECHGPVPVSMTHEDGIVQIAFGTIARSQASAPTWTRGTATCASAWCHGGNAALKGGTATSITWNTGATTNCTSCHGNPPPAPHVQNDNCNACHAGYSKASATTGTVNVATHVNGTIDYGTLSCTTCHGTAGRTGLDPNVAAAPPAGTAGETLNTQRAVGAHLAHLQGTTLRGPMTCPECHVVPASNLHADGTALVTFGTLSKTRGATPVWNGASCSTTYCHGDFTNGNAGNAPVWTGGPSQDACGTCHGTLSDPTPGGTHPTVAPATSCGNCHPGYTRTTVNLALHVNGVVDGGGEPSVGGTNCGTCHSTQFQAMTGAVPKTTKHTLAGGDNPIDPGSTWTNPLKSSSGYASAACVSMCHGDHPHDLTSPVTTTHNNNAYLDSTARSTSRTSSTRTSTDFDNSQTNGGLCLSCHQFPVDANHPAILKSLFAGSAHDYTSNAKGTWNFTLHDGSNFARNCTKCHSDRNDGRPSDASGPLGSVHFSDYPSLLAGTVNPAGAPATFVCNNCHGNASVGADLSGKDTASEFAKAQGHAAMNADTKHNTQTEATNSYNDGKLSGANRHVNCLDCHDPHAAGKISHNRSATGVATRNQIGTTSPLYSTSGVVFTPPAGNWSTPTSANFSFTSTATMEYQICFKCHTSWAYGASPPTGTSGQAETDLAVAFNPNNGSGHPVTTGLSSYGGSLSPKPLAASELGAPWNTNMGTQTMMCADCHGADAAAPAAQGPHASAATFMLVGANQTWPGSFGLSSTSWNTGIGTPAGLFCANCHPAWNANNVHSRGDHSGVKCTRCHILVPHGGKVSRLIATATGGLPTRLNGGSVAITAFKKASSPSGYSETSCSTNCGHHGPISGGETW